MPSLPPSTGPGREENSSPTATTEAAEVFGRAASTYDTVVPFFAHFGRLLVEDARLGSGDRVLDLGCGRGAALWPALAQVGGSGYVLGADLAAQMVLLTRADLDQHGVTNAEVRRLDAQALDLPDGSFDAVISNFVFHLLPEPALAAAEVWRVLRPGGRCVASFPSGSGPAWAFLEEVFGRSAELATGRIPLPFRPNFDLAAILAGAGFEVVATTEQTGAFTFTDEEAWWQWAWSHGMRSVFELLPADALDQLRREVFAELAGLRTTEGILLTQRASAVVAARR